MLNNLKTLATKEVPDSGDAIQDFYDKFDVRKMEDRLIHFISITQRYLNNAQSVAVINAAHYDLEECRSSAFKGWANLLTHHAPQTPEVIQLRDTLNNENNWANIDFGPTAQRVKDLVEQEYKNEVRVNELGYIGDSFIIDGFDTYLDCINEALTDEQLAEAGDSVDNFVSIFDYGPGDQITIPKYTEKTALIINRLKETIELNGKHLSEEEIAEYEVALNHANTLMGDPTINFNEFMQKKNAFDSAITKTMERNANERISDLGYDPNCVVKSGFNIEVGNYNKVVDNKEQAFFHARNDTEINFRPETKAHLKEILHKMHNLGFDRYGVTGEEGTKVYGLKKVYFAALKYQKAIESDDPIQMMNAAKYAKELKEADEATQEIMSLISKYLPIDYDNVSFPSNVDSVRTSQMPPQYRLDYIRASHLTALNTISNFIATKNYDIDDFVERPLHYIRLYYDNDFLPLVNAPTLKENSDPVDFIFSMGAFVHGNEADAMGYAGARMVEGLSHFEKDKELRLNNGAIQKLFNQTVDAPFSYLNLSRDIFAKHPRMDCLFFKPDLSIDQLGLKHYDPLQCKYIEAENPAFDEISYIKENRESPEKFKERLDEYILKYFKKEADLVEKVESSNVMTFSAYDFALLAQKAAAKYLILNRTEKDNPAYQQLESFVNNRRTYLNNLFNSIEHNGKYAQYEKVKTIANNGGLNVKNGHYINNEFNTENEYKNITTKYDNAVAQTKAQSVAQFAHFLENEQKFTNKLNKVFAEYEKAQKAYQNEVRMIYGNNYNGVINNTHNKKISDAFIKLNSSKKEFLDLKNKYTAKLEENVTNGRIPESYYEDRRIQLENNDYKNIPPLFRSDKQFANSNEYAKFRYPNDYRELDADQKEEIFNRYKQMCAIKENNFFSRKYLVRKELTTQNVERVDLHKLNDAILNEPIIQHAPLGNIDLKRAEFLNVSEDERAELHIDEEGHKFDEIKYLREKNDPINKFKANLDKKMLAYLNQYNNLKNDREALRNLPNLQDIIDVAQESAMKYLLVVDDYAKDTPEYNNLKKFIIDGNGYLNNLIENENNRRAQNNNVEPQLVFTMADFGITDHEINKYGNTIEDFNKYLGTKMNAPTQSSLKSYEDMMSSKMRAEYEKLTRLQNGHRRFIEDNGDEEANLFILQLSGIEFRNLLDHIGNVNDLYLREIRNSKEKLQNLKEEDKETINLFYRGGKIPEDYVKERYRRIDNNDFYPPTMYDYDSPISRDLYVQLKYPNDYKDLSSQQKKEIFNQFKMDSLENKRQFFLKQYMQEKGYSNKIDQNSPTYENYRRAKREAALNEIQINENIQNQRHEREQNYRQRQQNREQINQRMENSKSSFGSSLNKFELKGDNDFFKGDESIEAKSESLDKRDAREFGYIESELNPMHIEDAYYQKDEYKDPFVKWNEKLLEVIKERLGDEKYEEENIANNYKYDPLKEDLEDYILDKNDNLKLIFGDDLPYIYTEALLKLEPEWKERFDKEALKFNDKYFNYKDYFADPELVNFSFDASEDSIIKEDKHTGILKKVQKFDDKNEEKADELFQKKLEDDLKNGNNVKNDKNIIIEEEDEKGVEDVVIKDI